MGRSRLLRPEFFQHEALFELEASSGLPVRLAYAGLWTQADRRGVFGWSPRRLKTQILPYDDVDFAAILGLLVAAGFVEPYAVKGRTFGFIESFVRNQSLNHREAPSDDPGPGEADESVAWPFPASAVRLAIPTGGAREADGGPELNLTEGNLIKESARKGRKTSPPPAPAIASRSDSLASRAAPSGDLEESTKTKPDYSPDFERWYKHYPRKAHKREAFEAYESALGRATVEHLLDRVIAYAAAVIGQTDKTRIPHPSTWLNQDRFDHDFDRWQHLAGLRGDTVGRQIGGEL